MEIVAEGRAFPEGPVVMADGSDGGMVAACRDEPELALHNNG